MSYAAVAAQNMPPPSQQPQPDPALLSTEPPSTDNVADDAAKVNLVAPDFRANPATITSQSTVPPESASPAPTRAGKARSTARRYAHDAEEEGFYLWARTKDILFRPAVAGGILGLLNVGLLSGAGYAFYTRPYLRRDGPTLAATLAASLALGSVETYAAEKYRQTPAGKAEEERARTEGAALYRCAREHILRPGVLSGLVGFLNVGVLGALGYVAYTNWDRPHWDRRTVSAVSVALLGLWSGEGYIAERYRATRKH
ncbi:hypothetical protein AcW1_009094 [Taiwanofungus camphoratus]|nr:hypothetical protein AcW1_009094 [Antrodia cinnamomea]KAI0958688.1 hypothetical protein AcV7_004434 [Antrodia cinnamomea]